jgi:cell volume regulation protein A
MDLNFLFALLGGLLFLAFIANRLVRFTGVPDVIILMATGVIIGPVLHWVNPTQFRGSAHGFGSLALILILFEAGLDLKLRELVSHFASGFWLSVTSFVVSMTAVALIFRHVMHFTWVPSLLVGAVLGCTSSSIILPVLQQVNLRREAKVMLLVEASLSDGLAVITVSTLMDLAAGGNASPRGVAWALISSLVLASACGSLAGMLWSYLLPVLSEERFWHVLTFGAVLLVYSGVHFLQGNELVAIPVFGLTLSNFPAIRKRLKLDDKNAKIDWFYQMPMQSENHHEQMLSFHGELAFLIRTFFFVLLGTLVVFSEVRKLAWLALGCLGALFLARFIVVQLGRFAWRGFSPHEREIMVCFFPRGLITAVLGLQVVETRGTDFAFLPSLAFALILLTNLILLIGTLRARRILPQPETAAAQVPVENMMA